MIYHKERETNKSTPDIKLMNDNFHNKTSSAQFNETNKVLNRSHPGLPIPIISVSNRYNTSHSTNRLNQKTTELSSQHQIESDSILPNENESEIKLNKNYIYQNTTPTNQVNITHGNNIDSRTSNNKDQSYSFIPVQSNNPHRINSENLNLNNNRKIENVSILPNEDSDFLPTNKSNATDNFQSKNILADYQSHDLSINNNFNHNRDRSINIMHNHPPDNDKDDDNGVNDNDNDDNNKDEMIINVETENSSSPYNQLRDLDGGKEIYNLSGMKPLKTVVYLSIGPLMNQITSAIESFIETIWVSKAIGIEGMTAISSYMPFENITRAFGLTTACAGSNTISGFIANNESDKEEGSQVIADLLRVCLIIGIIVPAVLCPLIQMAVKWLGASDQIVKLGYKYILPILICTFFTCSYLGITGFLEGEGRPILYTVITLVTSLANILFLCPLFLLGFETGIVGAGLAQVLSHTIQPLFYLFFISQDISQ